MPLASLPAVRQIWYCVCDIELPAAQKVLRSDFYGTLKECDAGTGWLPAVSQLPLYNICLFV